MDYTQSQLLILFYTYCFLGWVWESLYVSFSRKEWINRGFLYGPAIPIYGFGAVLILWLTLPFKESIPHIYIIGLLGASTLEYVTGTLMEGIFNVRYWDYSHRKFHLNGRISLYTSLAWGLFSVLLIRVLHPPIENTLLQISASLAEPISLVLTIAFVVDATKSIQGAFDMKKLLKQLAENNEILSNLEVMLNEAATNISQSSDEFQRRIHKIERDIKHSVSNLFNEKAEEIINEIKLKLRTTSTESEKNQLSNVLENLRELNNRVKKAQLKLVTIRDKEYKRIINLIRKYPSSVSRRFKGVFNDIKLRSKSRKEK